MATSTLPMQIFRAEVLRTEQLTPGMVRVVFGGAGLRDFASTGVGDEYLRVFFPLEGQTEPNLPVPAGEYWEFPEGVEPAPLRTYTVRGLRAAAGEVVIDFVVHDGGIAAAWAQAARPGDVVGLNTPTGLYAPPSGLTWQLLLADATGLPAALRLAEQAPAGVRTRMVLEVLGPEHHHPVPQNPDVKVTWVHGGNGHGPSRLEEILRSTELPDGTGYIWVAGETKVLRGARKYLRRERALPSESFKVVGYWTDGAEEWRERYEALTDETKAELVALWSSDRDAEDIEDEYISRLEALGL